MVSDILVFRQPKVKALNTYMKPYNIAITTILSLLVGCKTVPMAKQPAGPSSTALESVIDHSEDSVSDIKRDANLILKESDLVKQGLEVQYAQRDLKSGSEEFVKVSSVEKSIESMNKIDSKAANIIEAADDLQKETAKLKSLTDEVDRLERSLTSLQITLNDTKAKAMEKLYGYISMFWVIGFLLIAGGAAVAFFLNKTYGGSLAFIGLLMLGFASASQYYMEEIALVGAILLVIGFITAIGMIAWSTINSKRNATAIREIVEMIQILKETMTDDEHERIFGENGIAAQVQSDLTKEIIAKIKEQNGFKKLEEARRSLRAPDGTSTPTTEGDQVTPS